MKKTLIYLQTLVLLAFAMTATLTSCGDDDGVEPLPQQSNFNYIIDDISAEMAAFYNIEATYMNIDGVMHTEKIDGLSWGKQGKKMSTDARFYCLVTAKLKETRPAMELETYEFEYKYRCECYRPDIKTKRVVGEYEKKIPAAELEKFLNENKTIQICKLEY